MKTLDASIDVIPGNTLQELRRVGVVAHLDRKGVDVAVKHVKDNLRVYPLAKKNDPPKTEFINGSKKSFNSIHPNDFTFYEHIDVIIQKEPLDMLDAETRGLFASIGIEKGKPFKPDSRMKKILTRRRGDRERHGPCNRLVSAHGRYHGRNSRLPGYPTAPG